jgi:imidazolonepropionase-like amidohydrolase
VGTDPFNPFIVPGASLHEELRLLEGAGLTTEEVWAVATRGAGEDLGDPLLGRIEPGAPADLLILRKDPLQDRTALETMEAVVADGRLYPKQALDEALERQRGHFEGLLYDRISMAIARGVAGLIRGARG